MSATEMPFEIIIKPKSVFTLGWKELWQYRELLYFFTWKEIKVRYKQAALGILWTVLQPLAMMTIFVLLLAQGLGIKTGNMPAPIYYLSGLLIWNLFNHAVTHASQSMVSNANIIKKIYFPRLVIPISAVLTSSFDFLISLVLFYGLLMYFSMSNVIDIAWLHLGISVLMAYGIAVFAAFSLGTFLSAINVKYRDVRYVLPFLIQTLFFITPVMYDTSIIRQNWIRKILELNPLNYAIELVRNNITYHDSIIWPEISWWVPAVMIMLYIISIYTFRKTEAYFADIV
ncbi:MAG: ABC transporter permease [Saprospiraceae bacterium]|nr:ABC transporter permease [Saprospiraceae bacterium]